MAIREWKTQLMVWLSKLSSWWVVQVIFIALSLFSLLSNSLCSLSLLLCLSLSLYIYSYLPPSLDNYVISEMKKRRRVWLMLKMNYWMTVWVHSLLAVTLSHCECEWEVAGCVCECGCACEWLPAIWIVKCAFEWLNRTIENYLAWAGWVSGLLWAWLRLAGSGWDGLGLVWIWPGLGWVGLGLAEAGWVLL